MNQILSSEEKILIGTDYMPAVSILMPFEPKMSLETETEHRLKVVIGKVEKELMASYPAEKAMPVLNKLHHLVRDLNFDTHKKSIAIFVSPLIEKVYYLDFHVVEKVVIDESFEIRDLVYNKKQSVQFLILILSGKSSKMYWADHSKLVLIKSSLPENIDAYERDMPEKVGNFSDQHNHHEILLWKFIHHMDEGLSLILKAYPLPVFVLGPAKVLGNFKKMTKNQKSLVGYIHGNYEYASITEILSAMKPYVAEWRKIKQQSILQELDEAASRHQLDAGMQAVWESATHKIGRLLIVERDFIYPTHLGEGPDHIDKQDPTEPNPFYIKDAVDDVMEKTLNNGGDVEFVDNGLLVAYDHIASIRYH
jgi:Bacterial archaeo-eukaryotic release factor family 3